MSGGISFNNCGFVLSNWTESNRTQLFYAGGDENEAGYLGTVFSKIRVYVKQPIHKKREDIQ